jgi:lysine decarboxylase
MKEILMENDTETASPGGQDEAPLVEAMRTYQKANPTSFEIPGHQSGKAAPSDVKKLFGSQTFKADTTIQKGLDDRAERKRVRQRAERLAAELWGAEHCYFSTGGSTLSNHVAMLAVASPGDTVLVARNSHKSMIASLILANVRPVFLEPDHSGPWDVGHGIRAAELERKLAAHPEAAAVFITSPTYYGIASDVARLAGICHRQGKPLVVDEAWGPHFAFHPEMPPSAIRCGADLSVGSIHKTMAGLEQASIILMNSRLIAADRLNNCFDLFESTTPSGLVLTSIDATRRQFAEEGRELLGHTLELARQAREEIGRMDGFRVMGREMLDGDGRFAMDETKVYFDISGLGLNGYEAEDWLIDERKLTLALSDERCLLAVFTVGSDAKSTRELLKELGKLAGRAREKRGELKGPPRSIPSRSELDGELAMTPAEAFYARTERVPLDRAAGRIASEMVSPYPPGIPRVLPGQRITPAQVEFLRITMDLGGFPVDASDMDLRTLRVVA